jgi:hypothetical protein
MTVARGLLPALAALLLTAGAVAQPVADPGSDAPEPTFARSRTADLPSSYPEAIRTWRGVSDVNAWIGARFEYDFQRAMRLSENQRARGPQFRIHEPVDFFGQPSGVCVDLARFAVETLRTVAPTVNARYLMIEFDPTVVSGNTLRRHWLVQYEADGRLYFFADSKRPGHVAGPYDSTSQFIEQYARYRQRPIVSYRILSTHERTLRQMVPRAAREAGT